MLSEYKLTFTLSMSLADFSPVELELYPFGDFLWFKEIA